MNSADFESVYERLNTAALAQRDRPKPGRLCRSEQKMTAALLVQSFGSIKELAVHCGLPQTTAWWALNEMRKRGKVTFHKHVVGKRSMLRVSLVDDSAGRADEED